MSEIEKQFFETFGIKAYYKYLLIDKTTKWRREKLLDKANFIDFVRSGKDYLLLKVIKYYPQITDRIYLELIRIHFGTRPYDNIGYRENLDKLKEFVLKELTESYRNDFYDFRGEVKEEVQALFKENN